MAQTGQTMAQEFAEFFLREYREDIAEFLESRSEDHRSFHVDWMDLYRSNTAVAEDLLDAPKQVREAATNGLRQAVKDLPVEVPLDQYGPVHVRFENLHGAEVRGTDETRSRHIGQYMELEGQVSKVSQISPKLRRAVFECHRCGTETPIPQSTGDGIQEPHECQGCERQGPFELVPDQSEWVDSQLVRIQQPPEETLGGQGAYLDAYLEDDAVIPLSNGAFKPGNRVSITGRYTVEGAKDGPSAFLDGDVVQVEESDYEKIDISREEAERIEAIAAGEEGDPYTLIVQSLAPSHYGDEHIKLTLALQMFRGVRSQRPDGSWTRGDSHLLLLGDPGVGKSSLLRRVAELAPRSAYASGKGASAAGMTAAAVPSDFGDEKWDVQAGVLVLATGGLACVDEIDKIQEDAVSSMHDALEAPQVVEVDKADIHTTLPAQTSLLAAGNPVHGRFNPHKDIAEQIDIAPTLLSRFDLMFLMVDDPDEERDRELAESMVRTRQAAVGYSHHDDAEAAETAEPPLDEDLLRKYIAYARQNYFPRIRDEAVRERLVDFFIQLRSMGGYEQHSPIPVTPRKLEGMLRLVEASARIRLSQIIEEEDVDRVAQLIIRSMNELGVNDEGEFDADVVETGYSKPQRDRIPLLKSIIQEHQEDHDNGARIEEVKGIMEQEGVDRSQTDHMIAKLKSRGDLYEPADGFIRTT